MFHSLNTSKIVFEYKWYGLDLHTSAAYIDLVNFVQQEILG